MEEKDLPFTKSSRTRSFRTRRLTQLSAPARAHLQEQFCVLTVIAVSLSVILTEQSKCAQSTSNNCFYLLLHFIEKTFSNYFALIIPLCAFSSLSLFLSDMKTVFQCHYEICYSFLDVAYNLILNLVWKRSTYKILCHRLFYPEEQVTIKGRRRRK